MKQLEKSYTRFCCDIKCVFANCSKKYYIDAQYVRPTLIMLTLQRLTKESAWLDSTGSPIN